LAPLTAGCQTFLHNTTFVTVLLGAHSWIFWACP
jgi:hypothetical protein